jgi:hypothetical protein
VSAAREALASALESAIEAWSDGDHYNAPAGDELLERLLGSEPGRRALVDVAAELGLDQLADALIVVAGSLQEVFESAVGVLRYGAGSEHPAGPDARPAAGEPAPAPDAGWVPYDYGDKTANPLPKTGDLVLIHDTHYHGVTLGLWNDGWWETATRSDDVHVTHWAPWNAPTPPPAEVTP